MFADRSQNDPGCDTEPVRPRIELVGLFGRFVFFIDAIPAYAAIIYVGFVVGLPVSADVAFAAINYSRVHLVNSIR